MQKMQMPIEQLDLLRVPGLSQFAHSCHFLQQFLLFLNPNCTATTEEESDLLP